MTSGALKNFPSFVIGVALTLAAAFGAGIAWADPPTRIARLSYFSGSVSFSPAGDDQWAHAVLNRPVITGDRLWSDDGGRIELTLDNGSLWLGAGTSAVVSNIDDRTTQFELQQGTLDLRVRRMSSGDVVEIDTPNLALQVTQAGRYRIEVDPQSGTTTVVVRNGAAEVYGDRASYVIASGQGYRFYGTDLQDSEFFTPRGVDEFERFVIERDSRFDRLVSARYVSPEVVGYEDLDRYGSWRPVESYGNVWFPQEVPSGWAPYRHGHWSWIDPWGWTWVDDAPWGFAPFHYGRWAYVQDRWGWVPGPVNVRPVYAPALVAFVGGANFSVSVSSGPAIGWFPLAPREVYRPAYNVSREYYRQVNVSNTVINTTVINNTYVANVTAATAPVTQQVNYVNMRAPNAVTAVPPAAFAQSQPVSRAAVALPSAVMNKAEIQSMVKIAPARAAFIGAAPPTQAKPPAGAQQQAVVAKSPPPPAPVPVSQKVPALEKDPGKPLDRAEIQANRTAGPATAPAQNVKIVNPGKPMTAAPPPAVQGDALRARTSPQGATSPVTAVPPAVQPGTAATPAPRPEPRGQLPTAPTLQSPGANEPTQNPAQPRASPPQQPAGVQLQPPTPHPPEQRAVPPEQPGPAPQAQPPAPRAPEQRVVPPEQPRPAPQAQPPAPRAPEQRVVPQEQPRPAPQTQQPAPRPPEQRAVPPEQPRPAPQAQPPAPRAPEQRVVPQEQPRPMPQTQQPAPRAPEQRVVPQEQPRPMPQAQQPAPRAPEQRVVPQEPPRPAPQGQPQPQAQPVPAVPPRPESKPDTKRDDRKDKDKEKPQG